MNKKIFVVILFSALLVVVLSALIFDWRASLTANSIRDVSRLQEQQAALINQANGIMQNASNGHAITEEEKAAMRELVEAITQMNIKNAQKIAEIARSIGDSRGGGSSPHSGY